MPGAKEAHRSCDIADALVGANQQRFSIANSAIKDILMRRHTRRLFERSYEVKEAHVGRSREFIERDIPRKVGLNEFLTVAKLRSRQASFRGDAFANILLGPQKIA